MNDSSEVLHPRGKVGHSHTAIHVAECFLKINEAQLGHSIPLFQGLQYGVQEAHHVQRGGVSLQVVKLLVINEVPHVCQAEARHIALQ